MKTALITGASSGFGKAMAEKFAEGEFRLILNARRKERLDQLKTDLEKEYNSEIYLLPFDVRDQKAVDSAISSIPPEWRNIDLLINNAGLAVGKEPIQEGVIDDWERMIDTNVKGLLYVSRQIMPMMVKRGQGHIINIGSTAGKETYPGGNVYCATKYAVDAISKSMRQDLLPHGIRVSQLNPGVAETEFSRVRFKGDQKKADSVYQGYKPLLAEDIAEIAYFTATLPPHICLNDVVITCTAQADSLHIYREN